MHKRFAVALLAACALPIGTAASAQDLLLAPVGKDGQIVPPFFEGWYRHADGSASFSFGYLNLNAADTLEIPIGPDNYIEPAEFNGLQPTTLLPGRHTGVFGVTVPADYTGDVVWHLRVNDRELSVPGRSSAKAYELSFQPMAMGSIPPEVRLERDGPVGRGPMGVYGPPQRARVGEPLPLTVWAVDRSEQQRPAPMALTWFKHQGPGSVTFADVTKNPDAEGRGTATATFGAPGEYVLRVMVDNFGAPDSAAQDQCCWTNGFVKVTVE